MTRRVDLEHSGEFCRLVINGGLMAIGTDDVRRDIVVRGKVGLMGTDLGIASR